VKELYAGHEVKLGNEILPELRQLDSSETSVPLRNAQEDAIGKNKENEVDLSPMRRKDNQLPNQFVSKSNKYFYQPNSELEKEEIKVGKMLIPSQNFENQSNKKAKPNPDDAQEKDITFTNDDKNRKIKNQNKRKDKNEPLQYQPNGEEMTKSITSDAEESHAERRLKLGNVIMPEFRQLSDSETNQSNRRNEVIETIKLDSNGVDYSSNQEEAEDV
jgi:hypothetical protein